MKSKSKTAFTLVELMALLAILTLLWIVIVPAVARTGPNSKAVHCLNNNRQMCQAWRMYAADGRDLLVYSSPDPTYNNLTNQYVWVQNTMDFNPNNRGNWDISYLRSSPLWPYCHQNAGIWKCPSDQSYVVVAGEKKPRIRSMEMNFYTGGPVSGSGWPFLPAYRVFSKITELIPSPSRIFVFLDLRPDAISWGNFLTDMTGYSPPAPAQDRIQDFPGNLHDGGCGFSFADGHGEMKHWRDARTMPPVNAIPGTPLVSPNNPDVAWLQDHATRPR